MESHNQNEAKRGQVIAEWTQAEAWIIQIKNKSGQFGQVMWSSHGNDSK